MGSLGKTPLAFALLHSVLQGQICLLLLSWRRQWHPTPVLLPGKPHGRRSLVSCSPWSHKESDMTESLHFTSRPHGSEILLLGIYPVKTIPVKDTCTPVFIAKVFTVVRTWKHSLLSMVWLGPLASKRPFICSPGESSTCP